jgi:hypothetical protein
MLLSSLAGLGLFSLKPLKRLVDPPASILVMGGLVNPIPEEKAKKKESAKNARGKSVPSKGNRISK